MDSSTVATASDDAKTTDSPSYGLRQHVLSPLETLAQSVSLIAPSTTPTLTVPLVFALCGAGTGLAYLIATVAMVLVAHQCVVRSGGHGEFVPHFNGFFLHENKRASAAVRAHYSVRRGFYDGLLGDHRLLQRAD